MPPPAADESAAAGFSWRLTPTTEPDPLVAAAPTEATTAPTEAATPAETVPMNLPTTASTEPAPAPAPTPVARAVRGGRRPTGRPTRILLWVLGALLALLVLILLFVLGARMNAGASEPVSAPGATPTRSSPTATPTPTPTRTVPPTPTVAASPGTHRWDALAGRECLRPYTSPWAQTFTVVPCAKPHEAQLVLRATFSTAPSVPYPGATQLASQIDLLCSKPGVIDLSAAAALDDVQVQGAYPATAAQWSAGQRSYFCFVSRASGKPITGSLAG